MNELKTNIGETEVSIKKMSTACTSEKIEDVLLEYFDRRTAKGIIATATIKNDAISKPDWIPEGFEYFTGDVETGYVVKDTKGNEFTYCPATDEYISRYEISKGDDGAPMSVPGKDVWVNITRKEAKELAKSFAVDGTSDLIENADWDKMWEFLSTKIGRALVFDDSTSIGAYYNNGGKVRTGENSSFMTYNIDCLAGNHWCITNGIDKNGYVVLRGGSYYCNGDYLPMASTSDISPDFRFYDIGFRIVLKK